MDDLLLQTLQRIEGKVDAIPAAINAVSVNVAKLETRVDNVEDDLKTTKNRQWWHSSVVVPVSALIHIFAHKLGY